MPQIRNLSGQTFGRLVVLSFTRIKDHRAYWLCKCECGVEREFSGHNLAQRKIKSCGCIGKETLLKRNTTHGGSYTAEYHSFQNAQGRCNNPKNPKYLDYGGRGIKFEYESFEQFLLDVGKKPTTQHSLERMDNGDNYRPGNCCWATKKEQANNRRFRSPQRLHEDLLVAYANQVMGVY